MRSAGRIAAARRGRRRGHGRCCRVVDRRRSRCRPTPDVWPHLSPMCCRRRCSIPRCCWPASAHLALLIGVGTAWLVTAVRFSRPRACWSGCCRCRWRSRPTSSPTSMSTCSSRWAWSIARCAIWFRLRRRDGRLPELRSLPGAIFVIGLVLYPYVYLVGARDVPTQSADVRRGRAHARRQPLAAVLAHLAADGAAGAGGRPRAGRCWKR